MLLRLILKNLLLRPLRYVLIGLAIGFGVAAVTSVFIFTDGLRDTFDDLVGNIEGGYDVKVQPYSPFGQALDVPPVSVEVAERLGTVDGVTEVYPQVFSPGVIPLNADDEPVVSLAGQNLGVNWVDNQEISKAYLIEGTEPQRRDQIMVDAGLADQAGYAIGERHRVITPVGNLEYEVSGIFNYADPETNNTTGALIIVFEAEEAVEVLNSGLGYDTVLLLSDSNAEDLVVGLEPLLDEFDQPLEAITQTDAEAETQAQFGQILGIFQTVLLVFAVIILLVSSFLIYNVFNITLGQRIKELGALRAVGAMGSQVSVMMIGEALILGVLATALGIPAGWLLARALRFFLSQLGFPGDTSLPIRPATLLYAVLVGVVVTILAALWPSIRARRISPMAALQDAGLATDNLDTEPSLIRAAIAVLTGAAFTIWTFASSGWAPRLVFPILAGIALFLGIRWLGFRGSRQLAAVGPLALGVAVLIAVFFVNAELGETFGMLGAGAGLVIVSASIVSQFFAAPVCRALGQMPTAIIVGLVGVAFALGAVGAIVGAVVVIADGTPAGAAILIAVPFLALIAYALLRTARGAFGLTGRLARDNAARNPQRTATTATALMVGLALVTTVTIIGDSIKSSVTAALETGITSDFFVSPEGAGPPLPFSSEVTEAVGNLPEVDDALPFRFVFTGMVSIIGDLDESETALAAEVVAAALASGDASEVVEAEQELGARFRTEPILATKLSSLDEHVDPRFVSRDLSVPVESTVYLEDDFAADRGLELGDTFTALFLDQQTETLTVAGIYEDAFILNEVVIDTSLWDKHLPAGQDLQFSVTTAEGVDPEAARTAIEAALTDYPTLNVLDREQVAADAEAQIDQTLATVNVLLALSALIAIFGIAVALSLAVFERIREIGLLRAVGSTREQTRWMIRWEGVIVAAFGGLVGVLIGVGLGWLASAQMPEFLVTTTSIPVGQLVTYVLIAALTGIGAGAFPAWVAGRLNVLEAIATE